ncbi:rickettsial conserved hypothetical protein [Rickettsia typhi str. Wilmington]|uniref:Uncharacterized protein n=2 Tax=Rickettsia typhi TaxID=785 RepID=Q68W60_RICTY|nr:hypothetical protein [Rickettsia typhi]AAU04132.1 rickettsial conserved hypothetical protein [Rickettsia typhi str. Wilmington]
MFYVQIYKICAYTYSNSVSILACTISISILCSWLIYNILIINTYIIIANVVGFIRALFILFLTIIIY